MDELKSLGSLRTRGAASGDSDGARSLGEAATMRAEAQRKRCRVGDVLLGRYRIVSELGQGGMGVVYRCFDEVGGIEVALKALPPEISHNSVEMEEVRENFRLVEGLHHPAIAAAKTLERDETTGDTYLIMECVEGVNLRQWRKRRPAPNASADPGRALADALPVVRKIAEALDYAHSRKIIHRDIKPSNVMLAADGTVKVLDFGLAAQIHTSMSRVSLAHYGTSGTGPYMAPEQWRGERQDARADQYALAATAYELLAGAPPFENPDPGILREAVLKEVPRPVPGLDQRAWAALQRALAKEPERRFPDCAAFVAALGGGTSHRAGRSLYWMGGVVAVAALAYGTQRACEAYLNRRAAEVAAAQAALREAMQRGRTEALRRDAAAALNAGDLPTADQAINLLAETTNGVRAAAETGAAIQTPVPAAVPAAVASESAPGVAGGVSRPDTPPLERPTQIAAGDGTPPDTAPIERPAQIAAGDGEAAVVAQGAAGEAPLSVRLDVAGGNRLFRKGEKIRFSLRTDKECYLGLVCHQPDGSAVVLFPNRYRPDSRVDGGGETLIPGTADSAFEIVIGPPYGTDRVEAIASTTKSDLHTLLERTVQKSQNAYGTIEGVSLASGIEKLEQASRSGNGAGHAQWARAHILVRTAE